MATQTEVQFKDIAGAVKLQLDKMANSTLFVVQYDRDVLYDRYLAAFPPGTNPRFRERTEHDCSTCRNFIKNVGGVVVIQDGQLTTIWDAKVPSPYREVFRALGDFVRSQPIDSIWMTNQTSYGCEKNYEETPAGIRTWYHLHCKVPVKCVNGSPDTPRGTARDISGVLRRGLEELTPQSLDEIVDLIQNGMLYRGEEHLKSVREFRDLQRKYRVLDERQRELFVWENYQSPAARFRNTVIGTLAQDLSDNKGLEASVKAFEHKVAPTNYKRPKALITPRMVEDAMGLIRELNLEDALHRRFAKFSDVSVEDVLFVDNSVRSKMKDGIEGLLLEVAEKTPPKLDGAPEISIEDFVREVLPKTRSIDLFLENRMGGNFVSLTAPAHAGHRDLLKWGNDFAWSYDGNYADSLIRRAVESKGGRVTGPFRFSHSWNYDKRNASLMDLHVFMPGSSMKVASGIDDYYGSGRRIGWNHRQDRSSGGSQDVDYVNPAPVGYIPVENIAFPSTEKMPEGDYICKIHNWSWRPPTEGGFRCEIELNGELHEYEHPEPLKDKQWVTVAVVTLKDHQFTIKHHLTPGTRVSEKWGVKTNQMVKVETMMLSPNFWGENAVGNKHWIFTLTGCRNPEPTRGLYNEFLNPRLEKHRKVFETLGDRLKCPVADEQLSGVGFSSTRKDRAKVIVGTDRGKRAYQIVF